MDEYYVCASLALTDTVLGKHESVHAFDQSRYDEGWGCWILILDGVMRVMSREE